MPGMGEGLTMNSRPKLLRYQLNIALTRVEYDALEEFALDKRLTRTAAARGILVTELEMLVAGLADARRRELAEAKAGKTGKSRKKRRAKS